MNEFFLHQLQEFNYLQFTALLFFVVTFQKSNTTKLIDKQTAELHESIKEIKDEIHWSVKNGAD